MTSHFEKQLVVVFSGYVLIFTVKVYVIMKLYEMRPEAGFRLSSPCENLF